jgi:hypothetical protein
MSNYPWYTLLNSNSNDIYSYEFVKDSLNNLYVVGYSNSKLINIADKQYSRNSTDDAAFIVKLDDEGNSIWFHWIDGAKKESTHSIVIDTENNIYITGYSESNSVTIKGEIYTTPTSNTSAGYIFKFNQNGDVEWLNWLDGNKSDIGYKIAIDKLNFLYIIGVSDSSTIMGSPTKNPTSDAAGFLIKMSSAGIITWFKWIDGSKYDDLYSIALDSENNIYVGGNSTSNIIKINNTSYTRENETPAIFLIKLDNNGDNKWGIWINGDNKNQITDLTCDNNNYIYLTGKTISKVISINGRGYNRTNNDDIYTSYVLKLNTNLNHNVEWFKWIQGDQRVSMYSLTTDYNNNLYITGSTNSEYLTIDDEAYENVTGNTNGFLIKINYFGTIEWHRWLFSTTAINSSNKYFPYIYITYILVDRNYNLYMTGYTNAKEVEFNDELILSKNGTSTNTFVFKYNLNNITLTEGLKSCIYVSNKKYIIYKSLFYFILFVVFIYSIWLLYKNKAK